MNSQGYKRVTRADVAHLAGVATGTVSHVLSGKPHVSPEIREKVFKAVEELGYKPDRIAGSLGRRRTKQLGVISPKFDNPHFGDILSGVQQEASSRGYVVLCAETHQSSEKIVNTLIECRVDAVVLSSFYGEEDLRPFTDEHIPIVTCGYQYTAMPQTAWVMPDHSEGARAGVEHLVSLGHTKIGILSGGGTVEFEERLAGWIDALKEHDLTPTIVVNGYYSHEEAVKSADVFIQSHVTAVLVANDIMAIALMNELMRKGINVPEELSIVGYDDIWLAGYSFPSLTSVNIHSHDMGVQAARVALDLVQAPDMANEVHQVRIPTELIVRNSTGRPIKYGTYNL